METPRIQAHVEQPVIIELRLGTGEIQQVFALGILQFQLEFDFKRGSGLHIQDLHTRKIQLGQAVGKGLIRVVPEHESVAFGEKSLFQAVEELLAVHF